MINLPLALNAERNPGPGEKGRGKKEQEKLAYQESLEEGVQEAI